MHKDIWKYMKAGKVSFRYLDRKIFDKRYQILRYKNQVINESRPSCF